MARSMSKAFGYADFAAGYFDFRGGDPGGPLNTPQYQVRTSAQGPVNVLVSAASVQTETPIPPTATNLLSNHYTSVSYNPATATLTLSGASDQVGPATVTRSETYRFVNPFVIDAQVTTGTTGSPIVFWYTPYTNFSNGLQPIWVGGNTTSYESPNSIRYWIRRYRQSGFRPARVRTG